MRNSCWCILMLSAGRMARSAYAAIGKFLWTKQLQPIAVGMKRQPELAWLADLPAHAVLDTVARLDGALWRMISERKAGRECGFPKPKKKFVNESGIYCVGQATSLETRERQRRDKIVFEARAVVLPKIGRVRLCGGAVPEKYRVLSARICRDGDRWMLSAQLAIPRPKPLPQSMSQSVLISVFPPSSPPMTEPGSIKSPPQSACARHKSGCGEHNARCRVERRGRPAAVSRRGGLPVFTARFASNERICCTRFRTG